MKTLAMFLIIPILTITLAAPSVLAGVDRCLSLDGNGDYVDLGQNTFNTLDDFTIEMWVRLDDKPWHEIFFGGNLEAAPRIAITIEPYLEITFGIVPAPGEWNGIAGIKISSWGQWFHVAAVFDKAGDGMFLYVNGELVGMNPYNAQSFSDFAEFDLTYLIGHYADGQIDEARVWSIARSQEDIQATMDIELEGTENGLVGYWKFNEAGGKIAYDSSPNGNNGTLVGDAYFARKVFVSPDGSDITGDGTAENPYQFKRGFLTLQPAVS